MKEIIKKLKIMTRRKLIVDINENEKKIKIIMSIDNNGI